LNFSKHISNDEAVGWSVVNRATYSRMLGCIVLHDPCELSVSQASVSLDCAGHIAADDLVAHCLAAPLKPVIVCY
jgi:hypothetical protein